jgi:hypothetical protein
MSPGATRIDTPNYDKTHVLDLLDWLSLSLLGGRDTSVFGTTDERIWPCMARVSLF